MVKISDPTKTITLRKLFSAQMKSRFKSIERAIKRSIVDNDCFGLRGESSIYAIKPPPSDWKEKIIPIEEKRYKFNTSAEKQSLFMQWLNNMIDKSVFQFVNFPVSPQGTEPVWANMYIDAAYTHGLILGRQRIKNDPLVMETIEINKDDVKTDIDSINDYADTAININRVSILFNRVFTDLKGITGEMDSRISRVLSQALIEGWSIPKIAEGIVNRVKAIGLHRATLLARTEIIRASHLGTIQAYRDAGILEVMIEAEWITARDSRVCSLCAPLDKKIFTLDEIEDAIPVHPNCRCSASPYVRETQYIFDK